MLNKHKHHQIYKPMFNIILHSLCSNIETTPVMISTSQSYINHQYMRDRHDVFAHPYGKDSEL